MLSDLAAIVDDMVSDAAGRLTPGARDRAIDLAVIQYGKDRPRALLADVVAAPAAEGTPAHLPLPAGWTDGSEALGVEYPVGEMPPRMLSRPAWGTLATPGGSLIAVPAEIGGQTCRLTWTLPHVVSATEDTIPAADREALCWYAAAVLLDQVAAATSGDRSSLMAADQVDQADKSKAYAARAATARRRYHDLLGIDVRRQSPASAIAAPAIAAGSKWGRLLFRRRDG